MFSLRNYGIALKKHIKFDDFSRSLFLRIKIDDERWLNITPEEAKEATARNNTKRNTRLRSLLSPDPEVSFFGERRRNSREEPIEVDVSPGDRLPDGPSGWQPAPRPS